MDSTKWKAPNFATSRPDQRTHEILDKLDRNLIIDDWQYSIMEEKLPTSEHFIEKGFDVMLSPWDDFDNISALGLAALKLNTLGLMATTWHTIHEKLTLIPFAGEYAWSGKRARSKEGFDLMRTAAASLQRKLVPSQGIYKDAGWNEDGTHL